MSEKRIERRVAPRPELKSTSKGKPRKIRRTRKKTRGGGKSAQSPQRPSKKKQEGTRGEGNGLQKKKADKEILPVTVPTWSRKNKGIKKKEPVGLALKEILHYLLETEGVSGGGKSPRGGRGVLHTESIGGDWKSGGEKHVVARWRRREKKKKGF